MDVLQTIKNDHFLILGGFERLNETGKISDFRKRLEALTGLLKFQLNLEHDHIYPEVLTSSKGSERSVEECMVSQKKVLKQLKSLDKLSDLKPPPSRVKIDEVVAEFYEVLAGHFKLEEEVVMPRIRDNIPTLDREDLGQFVDDLKTDAGIFEAYSETAGALTSRSSAIGLSA